MNKVILNYDENTGNLYDASGAQIVSWTGLKSFEPDNNLTLELIKQGVSVDEIIKLKNQDLI